VLLVEGGKWELGDSWRREAGKCGLHAMEVKMKWTPIFCPHVGSNFRVDVQTMFRRYWEEHFRKGKSE